MIGYFCNLTNILDGIIKYVKWNRRIKILYIKLNKARLSGFKEKLCNQQKDVNANSNRNKKKHQRKIIWFYPPFSKSVKTNLGKEFFKLLKRHFPKRHKMSKIFNKNTVKLSYSCWRNISSKISCCLTPSIVYRAIVSAINKPDKNTLEYLKLLSKTAITTIREILDTKNMLIARNCLNISGK